MTTARPLGVTIFGRPLPAQKSSDRAETLGMCSALGVVSMAKRAIAYVFSNSCAVFTELRPIQPVHAGVYKVWGSVFKVWEASMVNCGNGHNRGHLLQYWSEEKHPHTNVAQLFMSFRPIWLKLWCLDFEIFYHIKRSFQRQKTMFHEDSQNMECLIEIKSTIKNLFIYIS